jgi:hypothetical protein
MAQVIIENISKIYPGDGGREVAGKLILKDGRPPVV